MAQMLKRIGRVLLVAGALLFVSTQAFADNDHNNGRRLKLGHGVPEIDPIAAGAVVSLLVGGTVWIAARRRSRKPDSAQ